LGWLQVDYYICVIGRTKAGALSCSHAEHPVPRVLHKPPAFGQVAFFFGVRKLVRPRRPVRS
jgi:hypothetical protein